MFQWRDKNRSKSQNVNFHSTLSSLILTVRKVFSYHELMAMIEAYGSHDSENDSLVRLVLAFCIVSVQVVDWKYEIETADTSFLGLSWAGEKA